MNVWTLKLISIPIITAVNFLAGFLPYFFISRNIRLSFKQSAHSPTSTPSVIISPNMKRFLTLANFFCGGVFLSMCIIGLYPGVDQKFNNILKKYPSIFPYPYAGLALAFGFFFVWLLEILVHTCIHCNGHAKHSHDSQSSNTFKKLNNASKESDLLTMTSLNFPQPDFEDRLLNNYEEELPKPAKEIEDHEPHSHVPLTGNLLGSIMLTFALGSHSIIEGLGFGVMDEIGLTLNMLVTVLIHESICAVSLGINIASKKTSMKAAVVLIGIFSILIPVGIGLGLILDSGLQESLIRDILIAVLQGIAAGTFIYVVFMEILPNEMSHQKDALLRLFMMALGFAVIAGMKSTHSHSHVLRPNNQTATMMSPSSLAHTH